jgi:hypothetical protein
MSVMEKVTCAEPSVVRTFGMSWPLLVALLALLGVFSSVRFNTLLADPDTYWHLATGRWILEYGTVPQNDPFSHSMPGAAWTAHEWLSELVLTGVHQAAGWAGLAVLAALLFASTLAYVMRFLLARMEPVHALLFTAFTASMLMSHLLVRPHVLGWLPLAVWVGTLINAGEQGRGPPWWLLVLMVLWANLHGSFTLGLALGAALALDAVLLCPPGQRRMAALRWAGFVGLAVAAAMMTPSGWKGIWYTVEVMRMTVALDVIDEWRSPDFHQPQMLEFWMMLVLAISCAGRVRLPWLRLFLVLGLTHLALKHQRNVAVLGLLTPFLMAAPLAHQWRATAGVGRDAEKLDRVFRALAEPAQRGAMVVGALLAALLVGTAMQSSRFAPVAERSPEAAVQAAVRAGVIGPVLNSYNFGGYLIYSGVPVFMDGRADMYGDALLKRYIDALSLHEPEDLPRLLEDYRIGWTLLEPHTPALALLDRLPGWRRIHADGVAVVHVRDGGSAAR